MFIHLYYLEGCYLLCLLLFEQYTGKKKKKKVGSCLAVSRNAGNVVDSILSEGSHSVGGTDDCIHGNETHDGTCEKKTSHVDYNIISLL